MAFLLCIGCHNSRQLYAGQISVFGKDFQESAVVQAYNDFSTCLTNIGFRQISELRNGCACENIFKGGWHSWTNITITLTRSVQMKDGAFRILVNSKIRPESRKLTPEAWSDWQDMLSVVEGKWAATMVLTPVKEHRAGP